MNIASNTVNISSNTANIASNYADIALNIDNIASNDANIAIQTANTMNNGAAISWYHGSGKTKHNYLDCAKYQNRHSKKLYK